MAIAQGAVLREMKEALGEMVDPLAVMASIASAGTMYMLLWAMPEPVSVAAKLPRLPGAGRVSVLAEAQVGVRYAAVAEVEAVRALHRLQPGARRPGRPGP
jgi:hypothetical protein